jgi:hypothetical protein
MRVETTELTEKVLSTTRGSAQLRSVLAGESDQIQLPDGSVLRLVPVRHTAAVSETPQNYGNGVFRLISGLFRRSDS